MPSFTMFKPPFSDYRLILQKPYTLLKFSSIWLNSKLSSNPFREIRLEILAIYAIYLFMDFFVGNGLRSNSLVLILVSLALILDNGMQKLAKFAAPVLTGLLFAFSFDSSYTCSLKFYTAQIVLIATNNMLIALPFQIISSIQAFYIGDHHCPFNSFHHSLLCFMLLAQIRKLSLTNSAKIEAFRAQNELLKAQLQNQETKLKEDKILYQDLITLLSLDFKASVENIMSKIKLLQKAESPQTKENLQTARLNCETSLNLLKNIQDYSKVEAEDIDIHCVSANIRKSLEKTWLVCKEILKEKGLTGDILLHKNTPTLLMADPHRIHQILINLVQNSIKSTRKDFVRIIVSWFPIESSPPELNLNRTLSAKDNSLVLTKSVSKPELGDNVSGKKELDLLHVSRANVPSSCVANYFQLNEKTGRFPSGHHQKLYNTFDHYQGFLKIQVLDYGKDVSEHILEDLSQPASRFTHENSQSIENKNIRLWATRKICQKMEGDLQIFHGLNNISSSLAIIQAEISPQSIGTPTPSPSKPIDNKPSIVSMRNMGFMTLANSTQHLKPVDMNRISGTENKEEVKLRAMIANNVCYEQQLSKHYLEICGVEIKFETKNCQDACDELIGNKEKMYDLLFMNIDMDSAEGKSSCIKIRDYERKHKMEPVTIVILARDCDDNDLRYYLDQNGPIHADYLYKQPLTLKECQNLTRLVRKGKLKKKSHIERALDAFSSKALVYEKDIFQQVLLENYLKMGQIKYKTLSKEGVQKTFFMNPETVSAILYNCETDENECESFAKAIQSFIERRNLWKIPLIGIIGHKQIPKMEALRAAGFKDFLIKPFDYENVVKMLESPFMQDP